MRHRTLWSVIAALFLAATAGAAPPDTAPPTGPKAGSITALLPVAHIVRGPARQEVTAIAKKGDEVVWNDLVRTDKGGRARITLLDQSILSVGSQAELRIIKSDAKSQQTSIEVGYGRVRMEVTPITKQGGSFEVKTPTAVAGVIGTVFGIDSAIGATTFLCLSGTLMVGSNDPNVPGRVPCAAGMAAVVSTGKAPATRPATQREIQQFVQDTEPAVISAMNPNSLLPGATADATITGTQLGNVNTVSSSSPSVTATLNAGGTATSVSVHLVVAANATPGAVTLTLSKPSGVSSAAVFSILTPQTPAAAGEAPSIKGLSTTAAPSTGGVPVTITGTNFDPNTKVMFGNVASSNVTFVSPTQLTVIVPPENPGTVDITVVTGTGLTTTLSGGFSFGGPVAAINPPDATVSAGGPLRLDGKGSSDTLVNTTLTYSWTLCSLGFKPPQVGVSLPAMSAPACNPAGPSFLGTDSLFDLQAVPITGGQYFARLQVTDNLGGSAVTFSSITVTPIDDPATRITSLATAFASLQPQGALAFFDTSYPNLTALQATLQSYVKKLQSLTANVQIVPPNITGTTAVLQVSWQLRYSYANDPACLNAPPGCVPPSYPLTVTESYVWVLTPGKGWFITQGSLPSVPDLTASSPDLEMEGVVAQGVPGNPIPVGVGAQTFVATVKNIGTGASTPTTVHFAMSQLDGTPLGTADGALVPLGVGASGTATGTITIPNLTAVTKAQLVATVNPGCTMPETSCANNAKTFQVVITPPTVALPDLSTQITNVTSGATLATVLQTIQATVTNHGTAPFPASASAPVPVNFTVVAGNTVVSAQVKITSTIVVNQVVPVKADLNLTNVPTGPATLTVVASPTCPNPVEPDCLDNTASLPIVIASATIIVTSSQGNTSNANPVQLNGALPEGLLLTATRSDNNNNGSVTLTFSQSPVSSLPLQLTSLPYGSPTLVDFFATIVSNAVSVGPASVTVTPSNAAPPAGPQPTTLFFNIGDIQLSGTPSCLGLTGGQTPPFTFTIDAVNGFNVPTVNWQWSGFPNGVLVFDASSKMPSVSGTATLSGTTYSLPSFYFTSSITGVQTFQFVVSITNSQGAANNVFTLSINLSTAACPAGALIRFGHTTGLWSRGAYGGGMAKAASPPVKTASGMLPDLQINAASVSFTPSIPKPGDTVAVRFRVTNAGNADAQRVPISLVVNGVTVASDTFDVRAGASTLAALEWANTRGASRSLQAAVVVDPNHTVPQKSALAKSAPLAHFAFLPAWGEQTGTQLASATQRATLEVADGGCAGFRFASGAGSSCGSADVEITVEQLASGRFTLTAQSGIADLGPAFGGGKLAAVQYQREVLAVTGHSYAVQLGGGKTGILRLLAIRNPAQANAKGRQVFGAGNVARNVGGQTTGPVETGDVSGVRTPNQSKASFEVSYQTQ